MITKKLPALIAAIFVLLLLFVSGCFEMNKHVVWSPDGKWAAIATDDGLYMCDADGKLSGKLLSDVKVVAWFPDSQRLALSQTITYDSWRDFEALLPADTKENIKQDAQLALGLFKAGRDTKQVSAAITNLNDTEKSALGIYLKTVDGAQQSLGTNWAVVEKMGFDIDAIQLARFTNGVLTIENTLFREIGKINDIRVSPTQAAIAFMVKPFKANDKDLTLLKVCSLDPADPVKIVTAQAALFFDWTTDGHSLLYLTTTAIPSEQSELLLGTVSRRAVTNQDGRLQLQEKADELAGTIFHPYDKVRSLPDGRIIFSAMDVHLPCTVADMPQCEQLFALDPSRSAMLTRLIPQKVLGETPQLLGLFEVSSDGKRIAMIDEHKFVVFDIAGGTVDTISNKTDFEDTLPVWRGNELSFITALDTNAPKKLDVVLWDHGTVRAISSNWPAEVRDKFLDK